MFVWDSVHIILGTYVCICACEYVFTNLLTLPDLMTSTGEGCMRSRYDRRADSFTTHHLS